MDRKTDYKPGLHRIAILTACATFPLIFMGGLVTSYGAGMSVPDWPNSYGYNMFTFPPNKWIGGIFYEHTHRLAGMLTGFLSILLVLWAYGTGRNEETREKLWRWFYFMLAGNAAVALIRSLLKGHAIAVTWGTHGISIFSSIALVLACATFARHREPRTWVRRLAVAILVAVILQGTLGGLRVVLVNLDLAWIHGCIAQAFFCLVALMIAATSRWWQERTREPQPMRRPLIWLAGTAVVIIYTQLVLGALMRHYQAGLAIPDLPWAYGQYLPPVDSAGLKAVNQWRAWHPQMNLEPVTLGQIWLHFLHRLGAIAVTLAVIALAVYVVRRHLNEPLLVRPTWLLTLLLLAQLVLGVWTVLGRKPADIASYHVAAGALALFITFTIAVRGLSLYAPYAAVVRLPEREAPMAPAVGSATAEMQT